MKNILIVLLLIALATPPLGISQVSSTNEMSYEVDRVYYSLSITRDKLNEANTLVDLNKHHKPSWVREYISVEIIASTDGKAKKAASNSDKLSEEQKSLMKMADPGSAILAKIRYIPENSLPFSDIKEDNFTFSIDPEIEAEYIGGQQKLKKYLKENAIDKIPFENFNASNLAAILFTVNEEGQIVDAHVFDSLAQTTKDEKVNKILLDAICYMPNWKPAQYSNGQKVNQEFAFTFGNMQSCVINLLNIRRNNFQE